MADQSLVEKVRELKAGLAAANVLALAAERENVRQLEARLAAVVALQYKEWEKYEAIYAEQRGKYEALYAERGGYMLRSMRLEQELAAERCKVLAAIQIIEDSPGDENCNCWRCRALAVLTAAQEEGK